MQLETLVGVLHELEKDWVNCTNEFNFFKEYSTSHKKNIQQSPPPPPPSPKTNVGLNNIMNDEDDSFHV